MNSAKRKNRAIKRFWSRIRRRGPNDCWLWKLGSNSRGGYAITWWEGKTEMVHRIALMLDLNRKLKSPGRNLQGGKIIRHSCDNPLCCNPAHLLLSTQIQNIQDRDRKGRTSKGEHRYNAKLTKEKVKEIRHKYVPRKYGLVQLAKEYGVNFTTIDAIIKRKGWKHVD